MEGANSKIGNQTKDAKKWRPQRDSNPRRRRERPVSWARLDDGDFQFLQGKKKEMSREGIEPSTT